jgi:hypothetical protein
MGGGRQTETEMKKGQMRKMARESEVKKDEREGMKEPL